ncbi:hypothetical protein EYC79_04825 [Agrobacterium cavarae]|uniref:Uncharacterized protein n=1 Tax=Agrobacterium cavarae TaxID=2528239 RepID=A0ABY1YD81_9HYPH|nr:hypothetical protein [Agrobacterium cavarae]TBN17128.1 hypothetical protein EYC79_04825 [Agrobacterium cavarae]
MPIAPDAALKLVRPRRGARFADRITIGDKQHAEFIHNLGLNGKSFVAGTKQALAAVDFNELPYFDPNTERLSMVMQIYRAGELDRIVDNFWAKQVPHLPRAKVRAWFYREKFIPAVNKLFNPHNDSNAEVIGSSLDTAKVGQARFPGSLVADRRKQTLQFCGDANNGTFGQRGVP